MKKLLFTILFLQTTWAMCLDSPIPGILADEVMRTYDIIDKQIAELWTKIQKDLLTKIEKTEEENLKNIKQITILEQIINTTEKEQIFYKKQQKKLHSLNNEMIE